LRRLTETFHCAAVGIAHDAQLSQRLEVRGIRDPRKSTMEAWDAPGEPGDLSSLSAQTEWLNQQPRVWDCRIPEAEELDAAVQVSPSRARP
jgi:hypothetical protein